MQRTERAALACEIAAQGMEEACEELEKASEVCLIIASQVHGDLLCKRSLCSCEAS